MMRQVRIQHAEQALALALVAVDGRLYLLREVAVEHVGLPHHRTDAAHLEHQPLQHLRAALKSAGINSPVFSAR
jgi:hypothetical protein